MIIRTDPVIRGDPPAEDFRLTLNHLEEITGGQITPNEVLGNIFKISAWASSI